MNNSRDMPPVISTDEPQDVIALLCEGIALLTALYVELSAASHASNWGYTDRAARLERLRTIVRAL